MRRLILLVVGLLAVLGLPSYVFAASSSQSIIDDPDCLMGSIPGAGCLYVQAGSLGVDIRGPSGQTLGFSATDISGGGQVHIKQNGREAFYGNAVSTVPVSAFQTPGGSVVIAAGTQIPAPDFTWGGTNGGGTSYVRVIATSNIEWIGGIGVPVMPGGNTAFGTHIKLCNVSGGGQQITIPDANTTGALRLEAPSIVLGFLECVGLVYDNSGWLQESRSGAYYFQGGNRGGGRVMTTANAAPTALMSWPKGGATTAGIAFTCDVAAQLSGGSGTTLAYWQGVRCGIDGANNVVVPIGVQTTSGTNGGLPPAGWGLSCTVGASYLQLNSIGVAATSIIWRANNCAGLAAPF